MIKKALTIFFLIMITGGMVWADGPENTNEPPKVITEDAPHGGASSITGGIMILISLGVGYGMKTFYDRKNK